MSHEYNDASLVDDGDEVRTLSTRCKRQSTPPSTSSSPSQQYNHALFIPSFPPGLLLLSDSALPLGSFAFSSGLESYLAHHTHQHQQHHFARTRTPTYHEASTSNPETSSQSTNHSNETRLLPFLSLSLASLASTTLPYLLEAYRRPSRLRQLDNDLDASTPCTVARRASVAQGRALLGVWERSFRASAGAGGAATGYANGSDGRISDPANPSPSALETASVALSSFSSALKAPLASTARSTAGSVASTELTSFSASGHFAPLFALVSLLLGLSLQDAAYVYLLNHAKAVLSAGVRAGVLGPYKAQEVLASGWLSGEIEDGMRRNWEVSVEEAGQEAPVVDLWVGRHEILYSRIFNS